MAGRPWTDAETKRMVELHGKGLSLNAIATDLRRSPGVVQPHAKKEGLSFERSQTAAANEARRVDAAAKRLQLELDLLEDAQHIRARIRQKHTYFDWGGKDHDFDEHEVDEPIPGDQLKLMQAVGIAVDRSIKIAEHETGAGVERVKSMFAAMGEALGIAQFVPGADD